MTGVRTERSDGLLRVTLDRPAKRNALTMDMLDELAAAFSLASGPGIRVVAVTAEGPAFCAGNDLADMAANPDLTDDAPPTRMLRALSTLDAVLLAAVDGPAVGVGATLLLHCDLVYATASMSMRFPFTGLGLVPEAASTLLLPRVVGRQRAAEAFLLGAPVPALTAAEWGLVNEVLPGPAQLHERVEEVLALLLAQPPQALLETRRLLADEGTPTVAARLQQDAGVMRGLLAARYGMTAHDARTLVHRTDWR